MHTTKAFKKDKICIIFVEQCTFNVGVAWGLFSYQMIEILLSILCRGIGGSGCSK